jgi:integrase
VFIKICGDKPVDDYTSDDLQHFLNRVRHLPPNYSKAKGFDISQIDRIIDESIKAGTIGLSESTLVNNYVGKIKTIMKHGCASAGVLFALADARLIISNKIPKAQYKFLPSHDAVNAMFRTGVASGKLAEAILPLLGFLTGRRLGLLAYLRGEHIRQESGCWIVAPKSHVIERDKTIRVPIKTTESIGAFVMHNFLYDIGFIEWARHKPGFIFEYLHGTEDPTDTASKRMGRLFRAAGVDLQLYKTFHGLRHLKIAEARDAGFAARTTRLQVGHELQNVHDKYGGLMLRPAEIVAIASEPLPDDIDPGRCSKG